MLPDNIKNKAYNIVKEGQLQNMLFYSGPGTGKTTLAIALCKELGLDYILINGSKEGRLIGTVRDTVTHFANTMSVLGQSGLKVVIYDEFDNSGADVQMAIRGLMDEVSEGCRFIFTANYVTKIIEPLHSRVAMIDFSTPVDQQPYIMGKIMNRCCAIMSNEGVAYKKGVVVAFIKKFYPDFRKILNEFQSYASNGNKTIDDGILSIVTTPYEALAECVFNKDYKGCKMWMNSNSYDGSIYSLLNSALGKKLKGDLKELEVTLHASDGQRDHVVAVDPDLTLSKFCINVMGIL